MHDQVAALEARGVQATCLAGTLDAAEMRRRVAAVARGVFKLIYAAPERLGFAGFRGLLRGLECPLVAVDEAHCISEWSDDFRPECLQMSSMLSELPGAHALFEALRRYRLGVARAEGVPPYLVASDHTLREVARLRPRGEDELLLACGIGPAKLRRYGAGLLAVVADHA